MLPVAAALTAALRPQFVPRRRDVARDERDRQCVRVRVQLELSGVPLPRAHLAAPQVGGLVEALLVLRREAPLVELARLALVALLAGADASVFDEAALQFDYRHLRRHPWRDSRTE